MVGVEENAIYLGNVPKWMVRHMLGNARHSKYTARTKDGMKDAERIESFLKYALEQHEQELRDERTSDGMQFDTVLLKVGLKDPDVYDGEWINARQAFTRHLLDQTDTPSEHVRMAANYTIESVVREWDKSNRYES